jgi:hypothetical protein
MTLLKRFSELETDIFTEIARSIDKWLWFVETSQPAGS